MTSQKTSKPKTFTIKVVGLGASKRVKAFVGTTVAELQSALKADGTFVAVAEWQTSKGLVSKPLQKTDIVPDKATQVTFVPVTKGGF